ncbi:MAG: orotidine 5'-phosphate decarboxylase [Desulfurococcales archaeon]|nr:orotidine 5'-phosphate decarboxylase [Desulfurococcales archaeon]
MNCNVYLQVALDYTRLEDTVRIATDIPVEKWVILEAGTPLVKSEGMKSVSVLKSISHGRLVTADLKTMDTGGLEAGLAFDAGADISTVLAVAPDETIRSAVMEARGRGKMVMADLIGLKDPISHVPRLEDLGVDIILYHIGIDVQQGRKLTAGSRSSLVREISKETVKALIAVAGGVKPSESRELHDAGATIIIIGSAITKSHNPVEAIKVFEKTVSPVCR